MATEPSGVARVTPQPPINLAELRELCAHPYFGDYIEPEDMRALCDAVEAAQALILALPSGPLAPEHPSSARAQLRAALARFSGGPVSGD